MYVNIDERPIIKIWENAPVNGIIIMKCYNLDDTLTLSLQLGCFPHCYR